MSDTVREIRQLAREFAAAELRPHTERWDAERALDAELPAKLAELGFFGMLLPESAGGMELGMPAYLAALEELAWGEPSVAVLIAQNTVAAALLHRFGNSAHTDTVASLASGESLCCIAFAEREAHDDADLLRTSASSADDGHALSGTKHWVTGVDLADHALVLAQAEGAPHLFIAPRSAGGRMGERTDTLGLRPLCIADLELDGMQLPADARLTPVKGNVSELQDPIGALSMAAIAVGISQAALDHAVRYAGEREQFGQALRRFEAIQNKLAEMATRTAGARALLAAAAAGRQDGTVAMAKLAAGTTAMYVTTEAVQVFGGYGYMRDYPVEKLMRDAKAMEIMHGSNEVQRGRVAQSLYASS